MWRVCVTNGPPLKSNSGTVQSLLLAMLLCKQLQQLPCRVPVVICSRLESEIISSVSSSHLQEPRPRLWRACELFDRLKFGP